MTRTPTVQLHLIAEPAHAVALLTTRLEIARPTGLEVRRDAGSHGYAARRDATRGRSGTMTLLMPSKSAGAVLEQRLNDEPGPWRYFDPATPEAEVEQLIVTSTRLEYLPGTLLAELSIDWEEL